MRFPANDKGAKGQISHRGIAMGFDTGKPCSTGGVITISQYSRVTEAAKVMHEARVGCLVAVDDGGQMVGILSERDILDWISCATPSTYMQRVCDVMTRDVLTGEPGMSLDAARERMTANGIRHLPLVHRGVPVGMISLRDVLSRAV